MERNQTLESLRGLLSDQPTLAVVSSRLGHDTRLHRHICRFLTRSLLDCRSRDVRLLVACGSAIEPWVIRAAELFGVGTIRVAVGKNHPDADYFVADAESNTRDALVIQMADRVDAVYVRSSGTIAKCLAQRIDYRKDAMTRVAIAPNNQCAAPDLIATGAIGWFCPSPPRSPIRISTNEFHCHDDQWMRTDGQWLVHCTRGPRANWPDETTRQFQDTVLIGKETSVQRQSIDTLCRIIRSGRLIAASTATSKAFPVVCFSEVPLAELLNRRCYRPHLGRWDYEPFGIAIRCSAAARLGIQPVIYGEPDMRATLDQNDRYRFHPVGKTFDWQTEREWRSNESVDLTGLDRSDIRVFAADEGESRNRLAECPWPVSFLTQVASGRI